MKKTFQLVLRMQFLFLILFFAVSPFSARAQSGTKSAKQDTLNIGFVLYTKSKTPGTLIARWNYANLYNGPGIATGGPKTGGFAGHYHVRYFYENGDFSDEYDLVIENAGDFYSVSWISNGKVMATGVGMEVEEDLAVGWRRVTD